MPNAFTLPSREDGLEGLSTLAVRVGPKNFQAFVRWCRDGHDNLISEFMAQLAGAEIERVMADNPAMTYTAARLHVATQWGYTETTRPNFYRFANRGYTEVTGKEAR